MVSAIVHAFVSGRRRFDRAIGIEKRNCYTARRMEKVGGTGSALRDSSWEGRIMDQKFFLNLLAPQEVAEILNVAVKTVYDNQKRLGGFNPAGIKVIKVLRFHPDIIQQIVDEGIVDPKSPRFARSGQANDWRKYQRGGNGNEPSRLKPSLLRDTQTCSEILNNPQTV